MVKYRAHIFFVCAMLLYLVIRFLRFYVDGLPDFLRFYATDILFVPVMCTFALIAVRSIKRDAKIKLGAGLIFVQVVLVSLFFEWYLPNYSTKHNYTADSLDVLMYFIGGLLFVLVQRKL